MTNVSLTKNLKKTTPVIAIIPLEKLAVANEKLLATTPITVGPAAPPLSEINLHIPKKPPRLFGGYKSDPSVRTSPLEIPFPTPDKIAAIINVA